MNGTQYNQRSYNVYNHDGYLLNEHRSIDQARQIKNKYDSEWDGTGRKATIRVVWYDTIPNGHYNMVTNSSVGEIVVD